MKAVIKITSSVPAALKALAAMEQQLEAASTYEKLRRILQAAEALKVLLRHVDEVRQNAEWVIISANARIGEELKKVPKATRPHRPGDKNLPRGEDSKSGKAAAMPSGTSRHRLEKLAAISKPVRRRIVEELWKAGGNATIKAVLGEKREVDIKSARAAFENRRDAGGTVAQLEAIKTRFPVIYLDPPWEFKVYSGKGKQRSAERHYDTMSLEDIKRIPIPQLAEDNCALFMWAVWPELPGALEVIKAWGFDYKTAAFVWVKTVSEDNDATFTGMGYWTRANSEVCLLATRGSPQRDGKDVHQVITTPVMAHSVKPQEVRRRIERLVIGPYLELFAREPAEGWTVWGNEIEREAAE